MAFKSPYFYSWIVYYKDREEVRLQQVADVKAAFSNLKPNIPVLSVSGNHDVGNAPDKNSIHW